MIIARVQTWDHKQPDRAFYSYYHAHHLNKTLFQTQVYLDKKLIHRLHVLNPLTNTDIIGNVLYFMVVGKSTTVTKTKVAPTAVTTNAGAAAATPAAKVVADVVVAVQSPPGAPLRIDTSPVQSPTTTNDLPVPPSPSVAKLPRASDPVTLNRAIHNRDPDATIPEEEDDDEDEAREDQALSGHDQQMIPGSPVKGSAATAALSSNGWTLTSAVTGMAPDEFPTAAAITPSSPGAAAAAPTSGFRAVASKVSSKMASPRNKVLLDDDAKARKPASLQVRFPSRDFSWALTILTHSLSLSLSLSL